MKKLLIVVIAFCIGFFGFKFIFESGNDPESEESASVVDVEEKEQENWISLFDGTTFDGWHIYNQEGMSSEWTIEDGAMVFTPDKEVKGPGDIITDKEYSDFKLSLEWKISEGGNSGIFWGVFESEEYHSPYSTGPEIQVLDDINHSDGQYPTHRAGCLYDMLTLREPAVNPVGEWNKCEILINHKTNEGKVWLNGKLVVEFPVHGEGWDAMVADSKFKDWKGFGEYPTGKIGLQDHGDVVSYRNIKILEL